MGFNSWKYDIIRQQLVQEQHFVKKKNLKPFSQQTNEILDKTTEQV